MKKLLFIINPKAGVKKNKHFVDDALEIFERAGYKVGVKYTKKRADGTRIARDYGAKADLIVCMGNMRVIVSMLTTLDGGKTYTCNNVNECKLGESADYLYNE